MTNEVMPMCRCRRQRFSSEPWATPSRSRSRWAPVVRRRPFGFGCDGPHQVNIGMSTPSLATGAGPRAGPPDARWPGATYRWVTAGRPPSGGDDTGAWPGAHHREPAPAALPTGRTGAEGWCVAWPRFTLDLASPLTGTGPSVPTWDHTELRSIAFSHGPFPGRPILRSHRPLPPPDPSARRSEPAVLR